MGPIQTFPFGDEVNPDTNRTLFLLLLVLEVVVEYYKSWVAEIRFF